MTPDDPTTYARALLAEVLVAVRQSFRTPLWFGIDAPRIAAHAIERVEPPSSGHRSATALAEDLERITGDALEIELRFALPDDTSELANPLAALTAWLSRTHRQLGAVHPLAIHILGLCIEGEPRREIAERLELGLRLTNRIIQDMQTALTTAIATP